MRDTVVAILLQAHNLSNSTQRKQIFRTLFSLMPYLNCIVQEPKISPWSCWFFRASHEKGGREQKSTASETCYRDHSQLQNPKLCTSMRPPGASVTNESTSHQRDVHHDLANYSLHCPPVHICWSKSREKQGTRNLKHQNKVRKHTREQTTVCFLVNSTCKNCFKGLCIPEDRLKKILDLGRVWFRSKGPCAWKEHGSQADRFSLGFSSAT